MLGYILIIGLLGCVWAVKIQSVDNQKRLDDWNDEHDLNNAK